MQRLITEQNASLSTEEEIDINDILACLNEFNDLADLTFKFKTN